jgi:hypothetical protein
VARDRPGVFIHSGMAIGLTVLGAAFGVLDGARLLPQLPVATVANAPLHQGIKGK